MSAIAKPFISSSTAKNPNELVPVEEILSMDKLTITDPNVAANNKYQIVFVVNQLNAAPREIILNYASDAIRNTAFTNIKAAITTVI